MKDIHPEYELLISYADGLADATMQRRAIELIDSDADAAEFFNSLQATAGLLDDQLYPLPAVPHELVERIENAAMPDTSAAKIHDIHSDRLSSSRAADDNYFSTASSRATAGITRKPAGFGRLALAASLVGGMIGGAALYGSVNGLYFQSKDSLTLAQSVVPEWVRLVADYHLLYVRETVLASPVASAEAVSQQVSENLQIPFSVPQLDEQGIEFRRAQWLAVDDQPLLQLAYLPESGKPLAVCVLKKSTSQNIPAEFGETGGMQYVHWQKGEHAVVIVGAVSQQELQDINNVVEREML